MKNAFKLSMLEELENNVKMHSELLVDIRELILGTGHEKEFFKLLIKRVGQLKEHRQDVTYLDCFEKLQEAPNLYSMHLQTKNFNIRILYSYIRKDEILLRAFYERQGKSKTSYAKHTPIAMARREELEEK